MKKTNLLRMITAAALLLSLVFSFAACGQPVSQSSAEPTVAASAEPAEAASTEVSEQPSNKPVLTMATNAQFPPYEYYDGENVIGIDADIAALIANKLGMELKIEDMEFDSIITSVKSGKVDMGMAGMTITDERLKSVSFSTSYATGKQVIIVKDGSPIASSSDLNGKTIGVQLSTTGDLYITWDLVDKGLAKIERYNKGADAVQALVQGKIDAVVIDNEPAKVFVDQNKGLKILGTEYITEQYAICVAKDNAELLDKINTALNELIASGDVQAILDKYIKAD